VATHVPPPPPVLPEHLQPIRPQPLRDWLILGGVLVVVVMTMITAWWLLPVFLALILILLLMIYPVLLVDGAIGEIARHRPEARRGFGHLYPSRNGSDRLVIGLPGVGAPAEVLTGSEIGDPIDPLSTLGEFVAGDDNVMVFCFDRKQDFRLTQDQRDRLMAVYDETVLFEQLRRYIEATGCTRVSFVPHSFASYFVLRFVPWLEVNYPSAGFVVEGVEYVEPALAQRLTPRLHAKVFGTRKPGSLVQSAWERWLWARVFAADKAAWEVVKDDDDARARYEFHLYIKQFGINVSGMLSRLSAMDRSRIGPPLGGNPPDYKAMVVDVGDDEIADPDGNFALLEMALGFTPERRLLQRAGRHSQMLEHAQRWLPVQRDWIAHRDA
jgi:hypothetical protein